MLLHRVFLPAAAALLLSTLPELTQAQIVSNTSQGLAARDSVLARANQFHQLIEQKAARFDVSVIRLGKRRRVVRGYYIAKPVNGLTNVSSQKQRAWKHVARTLRTGVVRERYVGYIEKQKVLEETRTNQQLNYVRVGRLVYAPNTKYVVGRAPQGLLTKEGYVQWGREQYVLAVPSKL